MLLYATVCYCMLLYAIAFAPKMTGTLDGHFSDIPREAFNTFLQISAYSLIALARGVAPLMTEAGSIIALSYYTSQKVVPNYNLMAISKAALETSSMYLAHDFGKREAPIRVNCISAGPVQKLAARGVGGFLPCSKFTKNAAQSVVPAHLKSSALQRPSSQVTVQPASRDKLSM